jgi:hypothetical protein
VNRECALTAPDPVANRDLQDAIESAILAVACERFSAGLRSVVLTGSLARGEGTWRRHDGRARLAGDAELMLVFDRRSALPAAALILSAEQLIEARLAADGIDAKIGLSPITTSYLRSLRPHIFAYELRVHGKTIWGDLLLDLAPPFAPTDIPLEDGFRLLMNRIIELLEALSLDDCQRPLGEQIRNKASKLCLDMATSFLLFCGRYEPSYRARSQALAEYLAHSPVAPIPAARFVERTKLASRWKLSETLRQPIVTIEGLAALIGDVHALWHWELKMLTGSASATDDRAAMRAWRTSQTAAERLHGWVAVVKRCGLGGSAAALPRWTFAALSGSPRRLIYTAASELFFALPEVFHDGLSPVEKVSWLRLRRLLPQPGALAISGSWRSAAAAIAWNYHYFLVPTRA